VSAALELANLQILQQDWQGAKSTCIEIMRRYDNEYTQTPDLTPQHQRAVFTGLSQCSYELGDYRLAIDVGLAAVEMNRHFPDGRHYVILSYLATPGMREEAQRCAAQAVMFEAPWDKKHQAKVITQYRHHFLE